VTRKYDVEDKYGKKIGTLEEVPSTAEKAVGAAFGFLLIFALIGSVFAGIVIFCRRYPKIALALIGILITVGLFSSITQKMNTERNEAIRAVAAQKAEAARNAEQKRVKEKMFAQIPLEQNSWGMPIFSKDSKTLFVVSGQGNLLSISCESGKVRNRIVWEELRKKYQYKLDQRPAFQHVIPVSASELLLTSFPANFYIVDMIRGSVKNPALPKDQWKIPDNASITADGLKMLYISGRNPNLSIYNIAEQRILSSIPIEKTNPVISYWKLVISPNEKYIANIRGSLSEVQIFLSHEMRIYKRLELKNAHGGRFEVSQVAFANLTNMIAVAGPDGVKVIDYSTGNLIREIQDTYRRPEFGAGVSLAFSPSDKYLAYNGSKGVNLYRMDNGRTSQLLPPQGIQGISFSPDARLIALSSKSMLYVWEVDGLL